MKVRLGIIFAFLFSFSLFISPSFAEQKVYDYLKIVKLYIGEKNAEVNLAPATMDQAAYVKNGRTLVPFRFLGEALGAEINWDANKNQATLKLNGTEVKVTLGSNKAYVDGEISTLDVPAESKGGRTFIPLRFVSEALGASVDYDPDSEMVLIDYVDQSTWIEYKDTETGEVLFTYPPDWKIEEGKNTGIIYITSPRGSYTWVGSISKNMNDTIDYVRKEWPSNGYTLDEEYYLDPQDPNTGIMFAFINDEDPQEVDYIYVLQEEGTDLAYIIDMTMKHENFEVDDPIISEIIF